MNSSKMKYSTQNYFIDSIVTFLLLSKVCGLALSYLLLVVKGVLGMRPKKKHSGKRYGVSYYL